MGYHEGDIQREDAPLLDIDLETAETEGKEVHGETTSLRASFNVLCLVIGAGIVSFFSLIFRKQNWFSISLTCR